MSDKNFPFSLVIILVAVFGVASGIVGGIFGVYYFDPYSKIVYNNEVNIAQDLTNRQQVVIRGAKNVVVEHNRRIDEINNSIQNKMFRVFKAKDIKKEDSDNKETLSLDNLYIKSDSVAEVLALSSDGWFLGAFNDSISNMDFSNKKNWENKFIIMDRNQKEYKIDDFKKDSLTNQIFVHTSEFDGFDVVTISEDSQKFD